MVLYVSNTFSPEWWIIVHEKPVSFYFGKKNIILFDDFPTQSQTHMSFYPQWQNFKIDLIPLSNIIKR
jgi:hypothetical protein